MLGTRYSLSYDTVEFKIMEVNFNFLIYIYIYIHI